MKSIKLTDNVHLGSGWGELEHDEFLESFCWIGRQASLQLDPPLNNWHLYLMAGSPEFSGKRLLRLRCLGSNMEQKLRPGWHVYQFPMPGETTTGQPLQIDLAIDRLIDCPGDSRELGLMIREVSCLPRHIDNLEWLVRQRQERIDARCRYYQNKENPSILWLASYPRSGNTWMRFLLTNLLFKTVHDSKQIANYIDEIHDPSYFLHQSHRRTLRIFDSQPVHIVKNHQPLSYAMPLFNQTKAAIYVLRNPLDVAVSLCKWSDEDKKENLELFLRTGTTTNMALGGRGSWLGHVMSWLEVGDNLRPFPVYLVRYEDLIRDPVTTLRGLCGWLNIQRSDEQIQNAVMNSSLQRMKRLEERELAAKRSGIFYVPEQQARIKQGWRFLAEGKAENYRQYLNDAQIRTGMATFGAMMERFGYRNGAATE